MHHIVVDVFPLLERTLVSGEEFYVDLIDILVNKENVVEVFNFFRVIFQMCVEVLRHIFQQDLFEFIKSVVLHGNSSISKNYKRSN